MGRPSSHRGSRYGAASVLLHVLLVLFLVVLVGRGCGGAIGSAAVAGGGDAGAKLGNVLVVGAARLAIADHRGEVLGRNDEHAALDGFLADSVHGIVDVLVPLGPALLVHGQPLAANEVAGLAQVALEAEIVQVEIGV